MNRLIGSALLCGLALVTGCTGGNGTTNPFLTYAEALGVGSSGGSSGSGSNGSTGQTSAQIFRRAMTVTFANAHPTADLEFNYVAWVNTSSIRSAEQQDELLANGYVQLRADLKLGSVFVLPAGTFILNGPGTAGATRVFLKATGGGGAVSTESAVTLITPDAFLVFSQPPVSCDSVAFTYSRNGDPLTDEFQNIGEASPFEGSSGLGGFKTLSQVSAYQCEPLRPGMFLKIGGGARSPNEFFEGETITFQFNELPDASGDFAIVTIE